MASELPELDTQCPDCSTGEVVTDAWAEWDQQYREARDAWTENHPRESWLATPMAAGFYAAEPRKTKPCRRCEGTGYLLTEAGKDLLAFLQRHADEALHRVRFLAEPGDGTTEAAQ